MAAARSKEKVRQNRLVRPERTRSEQDDGIKDPLWDPDASYIQRFKDLCKENDEYIETHVEAHGSSEIHGNPEEDWSDYVDHFMVEWDPKAHSEISHTRFRPYKASFAKPNEAYAHLPTYPSGEPCIDSGSALRYMTASRDLGLSGRLSDFIRPLPRRRS